MTVSVRRRATRAAGLLSAGLLALGLAPAPSWADDGTDDGPSAAELRDHIETFDTGSAFDADAARQARRLDVVRDPRGDGESTRSLRGGPRPYTRLTDLTKVRYKAPSRLGGDLRITTSWDYLADARGPGARRQTQVTFFSQRFGEREWYVELGNDSNRVKVVQFDDETGEVVRIRPEKVRIRRDLGRDGSVDLILSSEWLGARRLSLGTFAFAGDFDAVDDTDVSKVLDVGPLR